MKEQDKFEKNIESAAVDRAYVFFDEHLNGVDVFRTSGVSEVFKDGIKWFRENLWHERDEQPEPKRDVFCCTSNMHDDGRIDDGVDVCHLPFALSDKEWNDFIDEMGLSYWCYASNLFNKID